MKDKYIIVDVRTMDFMKDENGVVCIYDTEQQACEVCGMYEFEDAWVCKLVFNHIEK